MKRLIMVLIFPFSSAEMLFCDTIFLKSGYVIINAEVAELQRDHIIVNVDRMRRIPTDNIRAIYFQPVQNQIPASIDYDDQKRTVIDTLTVPIPPDDTLSDCTIAVRNGTMLHGTVRFGVRTVHIIAGDGSEMILEASDIRKVTTRSGYPAAFGTDDNSLIRLTSSRFAYTETDTRHRLFSPDAGYEFGVGIGTAFPSSEFVYRMYPAVYAIDNFTANYSFEIGYFRRVSDHLYILLISEYSKTRFETTNEIAYWDMLTLQGGVRVIIPVTESVPIIGDLTAGYSFADMPRNIYVSTDRTSSGPSFRYGIGSVIYDRISWTLHYASHRTSAVNTTSPKHPLKTISLSVHYSIDGTHEE